MSRADVVFSVSTWQQPVPPPPTPERARVLSRIVELIGALGDGRLRIGVDGASAAGKTSLGHELARECANAGRPAFRASLDDFKRPWEGRSRDDRMSGMGYYQNAYDYEAVRTLLLDPAGPAGSGVVALCGIDPLTQIDHSAIKATIPSGGVLIVDGVFAFRPELSASWDLRIWVEIEDALSLRRGVARDGAAADRVYQDRYLASERLYRSEVNPRALADVIIDNARIQEPRLVRPTP